MRYIRLKCECPACGYVWWSGPKPDNQPLRLPRRCPRCQCTDVRDAADSDNAKMRQYMKTAGIERTMAKFNVSRPALEARLQHDNELSDSAKAKLLAEMALAGNAELRREVRELKEAYGQLIETVVGGITTRLAAALRNADWNLPALLQSSGPEDDSLDALLAEHKKFNNSSDGLAAYREVGRAALNNTEEKLTALPAAK